MPEVVTSKNQPAERIYPAAPMQFAQAPRATGSDRRRTALHRHNANRLIFLPGSTL
jgi:hypothetical protein